MTTPRGAISSSVAFGRLEGTNASVSPEAQAPTLSAELSSRALTIRTQAELVDWLRRCERVE